MRSLLRSSSTDRAIGVFRGVIRYVCKEGAAAKRATPPPPRRHGRYESVTTARPPCRRPSLVLDPYIRGQNATHSRNPARNSAALPPKARIAVGVAGSRRSPSQRLRSLLGFDRRGAMQWRGRPNCPDRQGRAQSTARPRSLLTLGSGRSRLRKTAGGLEESRFLDVIGG